MDQVRCGHSPYPPAWCGVTGWRNRWEGMTTSLGLRPPAPNPGRSAAQASGSKAENNSGFQTVWRWPKDKSEQRMGSIHVIISLGIRLFPSTSVEDFTSFQS